MHHLLPIRLPVWSCISPGSVQFSTNCTETKKHRRCSIKTTRDSRRCHNKSRLFTIHWRSERLAPMCRRDVTIKPSSVYLYHCQNRNLQRESIRWVYDAGMQPALEQHNGRTPHIQYHSEAQRIANNKMLLVLVMKDKIGKGKVASFYCMELLTSNINANNRNIRLPLSFELYWHYKPFYC